MSKPTIQLADPVADRARPESIAMVAVAAWGVGFVLMLGVARLSPHGPAGDTSDVAQIARAQLPGTEAEPTRIVATQRGLGPIDEPAPSDKDESDAVHVVRPRATAAVATEDQSDEIAGRDLLPRGQSTPVSESITNSAPSPIADPKLQPVAAPVLAPSPAAPPPAAANVDPIANVAKPEPTKKSSGKREVSRGVLAYLRCEGSERPHARFPCPRDAKFEERVWHVFEALPMCDIDPGAGTIEARITLRKSQVSGIEWKASGADPSLNLRAIGKCAGLPLAGMTTRLKAPEGLVSFRFSLE